MAEFEEVVYSAVIEAGGMYEAEWHTVYIYANTQLVSERDVYGWFRRSRARRLARRMIRDAEDGIAWR